MRRGADDARAWLLGALLALAACTTPAPERGAPAPPGEPRDVPALGGPRPKLLPAEARAAPSPRVE